MRVERGAPLPTLLRAPPATALRGGAAAAGAAAGGVGAADPLTRLLTLLGCAPVRPRHAQPLYGAVPLLLSQRREASALPTL